MRKILVIIFFILFLSITTVYSNDFYSYLKSDDSYRVYTITIEGLNTKNIYNYLNEVKILRIYPRINPIYKDKIGNVFYQFRGVDDIEIFTKEFLKLIKKNSFDDYNYSYICGDDIEKLDVIIKGSELYDLINKYNVKIVDN